MGNQGKRELSKATGSDQRNYLILGDIEKYCGLVDYFWTNCRNKKGLAFLLSLCFVWCRHHESNTGPTDYKSVALPDELCRHISNHRHD